MIANAVLHRALMIVGEVEHEQIAKVELLRSPRS